MEETKAKVTRYRSLIDDIINRKAKSPIDIMVIPNYMGINLCSVEAVTWNELDIGDGSPQIINLTIEFKPNLNGHGNSS